MAVASAQAVPATINQAAIARIAARHGAGRHQAVCGRILAVSD
jgi:hypothetical protein